MWVDPIRNTKLRHSTDPSVLSLPSHTFPSPSPPHPRETTLINSRHKPPIRMIPIAQCTMDQFLHYACAIPAEGSTDGPTTPEATSQVL